MGWSWAGITGLTGCWVRIRPEILAGWDCGLKRVSWAGSWIHGPNLALGQLEEELGWQLDSRPKSCAGPAGGEFLAGWSGARRIEPSWRYLRKKGEEKKGK
ncbi:hypothetical protein TIFTF001_020584 [Ficus carica]|uniref:Uncharacterized protein n=1 Tax=Ficus carica TaxID=3494 RepID=A0AA88AU72_FICCA|nr:hypothetical protein TIFTF001_020584 [Ficus carica]